MTKKKEVQYYDTFEDFCTAHLECLGEIKALALEADEGQPQPFCTMEISQIEAAMERILTAYWNATIESDGDDTEEIETDEDEEVEEENGEEETEEETA